MDATTLPERLRVDGAGLVPSADTLHSVTIDPLSEELYAAAVALWRETG